MGIVIEGATRSSVSYTEPASPLVGEVWFKPTAAEEDITNDFSAGESLDTVNFGTSVAGTGTVSVADNKLTGTSGTTENNAWACFWKSKVSTASRIYERKFSFTSGLADVAAPVLFLQNHADTSWAVADNTTINGQSRGQLTYVDQSDDLRYVAASYVGSSATYFWDTALNSGAGGWTTEAVIPANQLGAGLTNGTTYIVRLVTSATGFKWQFCDSAGTLVKETSVVAWGDVKSPSSDLWAGFGDYYTNYYYNTQVTHWLKLTNS